MSEEQISSLMRWLQAHAYSGECGTDGPYLRMEEMEKYLPVAIQEIMKDQKGTL